MLKRIVSLVLVLVLVACATTQSTQQTYVQACAAYNAAFTSALNARVAGKLSQNQIDQITLLDSQITPICTGPLPTDPTAATQQITAAVTTMAVLAGINTEEGVAK